MAEEYVPGMTYGRYTIPQTPNGFEWLQQFRNSDPEQYRRVIEALGGEEGAKKAYYLNQNPLIPGADVVKPTDTSAVDEFAKTNVDAGEWYRKHAYDQQPGFQGQFQRYLNYIQEGVPPQEAQDRLIGGGAYQGPVDTSGTANVNPLTGQAYKPEEMRWDPSVGKMVPINKAASAQVSTQAAAAPIDAEPTSHTAEGYITPEYSAWSERQKAKTKAAAEAQVGQLQGGWAGIAQKRIAAGEDVETGVSQKKIDDLQQKIALANSDKDRNTLLAASDPALLTADQRQQRTAARQAQNMAEYGVRDLSALNERYVYLGKTGSRFLDPSTRSAYFDAGSPGGFSARYGDVTVTDQNTGRETIFGNVPKTISYNTPKVDQINKYAGMFGNIAIPLGAALVTGGAALPAGAGMLGGALAGMAGAAGGMGAGSIMENKLPAPTSAALQFGMGAVLGGASKYLRGVTAKGAQGLAKESYRLQGLDQLRAGLRGLPQPY